MKNFLLKVVNGRSEEWQRISLLLTMGFFTGIFVATYDVGSSTLFLDYHKKDEETALAIAFITSGVLGIIVTYIIGILQKRISYQKLTFIALGFILMLVGAMGIWLRFDNTSELVLFCAFVLIGPSNAVVILFFWGIFGRIFNFVGAKRLAGGIDSGQAIATIFAFFSIPFVQDWLSSVSDFLLISTVSLTGAFMAAVAITQKFEFFDRKKKATTQVKHNTDQSKFVRKDYIFLMSLFVTCSALSAHFVDFSFLTVASQQFENKNDLVKYLSFFGGTVIIFSFLIQTFINDIILEQYGLKIALLILPILLFLFTGAATFVGQFFGITPDTAGDNFLIFFVVVSMSKLFVDALRDSLENPTVKIFFFPLDVDIRFDIQTRIEGVVSQFAGFLAGCIIIGLGAFQFGDLLLNNYVLFIIIGIWIYATFKIHKSYTKALTATLASSHDGESGVENDNVVPHLLKKELEKAEGLKYKYALDIAEKINPILTEQSLQGFEGFFSSDKQRLALKKIGKRRVFSLLPSLKESLSSNKVNNLANKSLLEEVYGKLREDKRKGNKISIVSELASSPEPTDRIESCHLITQNINEDTFRLLTPLIRDAHPDVRRAAMFTAGKLQLEDFLTVLISCMSEVGYENTAVASILNYGTLAMPPLETAFYKSGQKQNVQINIVQIYGIVGGERAMELLLKKIDYPDRRVAKEVLIALNQCNWTATGAIRAIVRAFLDKALYDTLWNKAALTEIEVGQGNTYLKKALEEQEVSSTNEIFLLLSVLYDKESVQLVKKNMEANTDDSIGYAMELLDVFVEDDIKVKMMPVLDESPIEAKIKKLDSEFPREHFDSYQILKEIISRDYNSVNRWTKVCAIHSLVYHPEAEVTQDLVAHIFNPDQLIQETAAWAICKLSTDVYEQSTKRLPPHQVRDLNAIAIPAVLDDRLLSLEKVVLLYDIPIFRGISGAVLSDIIEWMESIDLQMGEEISLKDDFGHQRLLIITQGKVAFRDTNGNLSAFKGENEVISDALMLQGAFSLQNPVAVEDSKLYVIPSERFYEIMGDHYELTEKVLQNIYKEIEKMPQYEQEMAVNN